MTEDRKRIVWSNETKINRLRLDGLKWEWKKKGSRISDNEVN